MAVTQYPCVTGIYREVFSQGVPSIQTGAFEYISGADPGFWKRGAQFFFEK